MTIFNYSLDKFFFFLKNEYKTIFRYLVSGLFVMITDLAILFFLVNFLSWWYLPASVVAFTVAFFVSFVLQKWWTFSDRSTHLILKQLGQYAITSSGNLAVNTGLMWFLVDRLRVSYIWSQIITVGLVSIVLFFIYRYGIFRLSRDY